MDTERNGRVGIFELSRSSLPPERVVPSSEPAHHPLTLARSRELRNTELRIPIHLPTPQLRYLLLNALVLFNLLGARALGDMCV